MDAIEPFAPAPAAADLGPAKAPAARGRGGLLRRFRRDRRGAAAIEFAFLALPFFMLLFATIETGTVFLGELTLDQAVDRIGRTVRTGEVQKAALTKEQFRQKICDEVGFLMTCADLMIDVATYPSFDKIPPPLTNGVLDTSGFGYNPGSGETITALRVFYRWPIHVDLMRAALADNGGKTHLLYAIAAFKTEPF